MKFQVGQSTAFSKTITETDIYTFAGICGDFNPVHINKVQAKQSVFGKRVAHGMLVLSFLSTVLGMYLLGSGTIYTKQELKFLRPVFIGDTVTAQVEMIQLSDQGRAKLKTQVFNQDGQCVVDGVAEVVLPKHKEKIS